MSDDEHKALLEIAAAAGLTSSDYLRQHIRQTFAILAAKPKKKGAR